MKIYDNEIDKSLIKGFLNGLLIPFVLVIVVAFFEPRYSLLSAGAWLLLSHIVYKYDSSKREAALWFYSFVLIWPVFTIVYLLLIISGGIV